MNRAIKSTRSSYHLVPNRNRCRLCDSREMTILGPQDRELGLLWKCKDCLGYQLQEIEPPRRLSFSWADNVEAEYPASEVEGISNEEVQRLLEDSESDDEYECDCENPDCPVCFEDVTDDEFTADHPVHNKPGSSATPSREDSVIQDRPTPKLILPPKEPIWTHLAQSRKMSENDLEELERYRRAYWGGSYDSMVESGALATLDRIYERYTSVNPAVAALEDITKPSDILDRMNEKLQEIRDRRKQTMRSLDYIHSRIQAISDKRSNLSVIMWPGQDQTAQEETHVSVNQPMEVDESDRPRPVFPAPRPVFLATDVRMRNEAGEEDSPPADAHPPPKRQKLESTDPQFSCGSDSMEDQA